MRQAWATLSELTLGSSMKLGRAVEMSPRVFREQFTSWDRMSQAASADSVLLSTWEATGEGEETCEEGEGTHEEGEEQRSPSIQKDFLINRGWTLWWHTTYFLSLLYYLIYTVLLDKIRQNFKNDCARGCSKYQQHKHSNRVINNRLINNRITFCNKCTNVQ